MLKILRTKTKKIMWATLILVIPSFVMYFGWSTLTRSDRVSIDSANFVFGSFLPPGSYRYGIKGWADWKDVTRDDMLQAGEFMKSQMKRMWGPDTLRQISSQVPDEDLFGVGDRLMNTLNVYAVRTYAERYSVQASKEEVVQSIRQMFPGWTDRQMKAAIQRQGMSELGFEQSVRVDIRNEYVVQDFMARAKVSTPDLWREYRLREEKLDAGSVSFHLEDFISRIDVNETSLKDFYDRNQESFRMGKQRQYAFAYLTRESLRPSVHPTKEEIASYYEENKESLYTKGPQARIRHIFLRMATKPGAGPDAFSAAAQETFKRAQEIKATLDKGGDFAQTANQISQDPENVSLDGKTKHGGRVAQAVSSESVAEYGQRFVDEVLKLKRGQISDPLPLTGPRGVGFSIVQCEEVEESSTRPLDEVRDRVTSDCLESKLTEAFQNKYDEIKTQVRGFNDIQFLAGKLGMEAGATSWVLTAASFIAPELSAMDPTDLDYVQKTMEVGTISDLLWSPDLLYVVQVQREKPSYIQDFADVRDRAESLYRAEKGREKMKAAAEDFMTSATTPAAMKSRAAQLNLPYREVAGVTRGELADDLTTGTLGVVLDFERDSANIQSGETRLSAVGDAEDKAIAYTVWHVTGIKAPDRAAFIEQLPALRKARLEIKQNAIVDEWLLDQRRAMQFRLSPEL